MSVNPMDLTGRTILITGASSGIGRETAVLLSQLNARLVLVARNRDRLEQTLTMLEGPGHLIECFDLTALDTIPAWMKGVVSRANVLDAVVHSAGRPGVFPLRTLTVSQTNEILEINLSAALFLAKGFRQRGCHAERGCIVFLSSVAGLRGHAGISAYTASKSALIGITRSLSQELTRDGIRVNCVAPGLVATEMADTLDDQTIEGRSGVASAHPLGIGTPRDVAHAIAFLVSDAARWITGSTLVVDGGYTAQ